VEAAEPAGADASPQNRDVLQTMTVSESTVAGVGGIGRWLKRQEAAMSGTPAGWKPAGGGRGSMALSVLLRED